ncbi:MAG: hypothetical protein PHF63_00425 [Herbinix sp.]|nr:hypothetical protein [Herbinix sp.]
MNQKDQIIDVDFTPVEDTEIQEVQPTAETREPMMEDMPENLEFQNSPFIKAVSTKQQFEEIQHNIDKAKKDLIESVEDEETLDEIDHFIANKTIEELDKISMLEYSEFLKSIDFKVSNIVDIEDPQKQLVFFKDFIKHCKRVDDYIKEMEGLTAAFAEEVAKSNLEIDMMMKQYGSVTNFTKKAIDSALENVTAKNDEKKIEAYTKLKKSFDDSFTLEPLRELYSTLNRQNAIKDYNSDSRTLDIYKKYEKIKDFLRIKMDILNSAFENLENKFLPEEYHKYPNLILFLIIRYYSYKKIDSVDRMTDGMFLNQFLTNVFDLVNGTIDDNDKEVFINGIKNVLELFCKD